MGNHPLRQFRENRGLSPADLARFLGVTRPTVHRWETGERKVSRTLLSAIADKTGISERKLRPDLAKLMSR